MRIAILSQNDGIFSYDFLKPFFQIIDSKQDYVITSLNLSYSGFVGKKETGLQKLTRVRKTFGIKFTLFSLFTYVKNLILLKNVKRLSAIYGVEAFNIRTGVNSTDFQDRLKLEKVDIVVIVAGTEIIRKETLSIPRLGFINCHSSVLPKHKGLMPVFWSLLSQETGFTWYTLNEGIDTGQVLLQKKIAVKRSYVEQLRFTKQQAALSLVEAIDIRARELEPRIIKEVSSSYNKFPTRQDVELLKRQLKLI